MSAKSFNLHTIVRLPNGVFAPYTGIPTNILFFDLGDPIRDAWYYEQPLPEGRKNYTKPMPINSTSSPRFPLGGANANKTTARGKSLQRSFWPMAAISAA